MYAKLFTSLYQGTLRGCADEILVFTNLLAHADATGLVDKHWRSISEETGISIERVKTAIANLEAPDPESRSPEMEGRRIVPLDEHRAWGWHIVNYGKYRAIRNEDDRREQNRLAQQRWRDKQKSDGVNKISRVSQDKPKQKQEAEEEENTQNAWTGKPKNLESSHCPSSPESDQPAAEIFVGTVLASVTKELGLTKLSVSVQRDWANHALLAFENNFTVEQFLECFRLLRGQTWRTSPVQPKHVMDGLPELAKLRREGKQNGSTERLPTLAEKLADDQANRQNLRKAPTTV